MNNLDLFSGIGGFSLGLERAGMQTVAFCEKDKFCQKVLHKHWPDVPLFEDIHDITIESLQGRGVGKIDIITGGFPCQPFSVAGQQGGKNDDRYLWPAMFNVIKSVKPAWVLCENVTGIIPMALDEVLSDLEDKAYTTQTFIIPACSLNAPHRRERVWILAHSDKSRLQENKQKSCASKRIFKKTSNHFDGFVSIGGVDPTRKCLKVRRGDGFPEGVDRLKGLGNAVVPQIVEEIGMCILGSDSWA